MRTPLEAVHDRYNRYTRASQALADKYRARLMAAHPELGSDATFHVCHNWGNDAARAILAKYNRRAARLARRRDTEFWRAYRAVRS